MLLLKSAVFYNKISLFLLILYIGLITWLESQLTMIKHKDSIVLVSIGVSLFGFMKGPIQSILTISIRNTATTLGRYAYLLQIFNQNEPHYNKAHAGILKSRVRRIEYVFFGLERDLTSCIIYIPTVCITLFRLYKFNVNPFAIAFIILSNLGSWIFINPWIEKRARAFKADELLYEQIWKLLNNLSRKCSLELIINDINTALSAELTIYSNTIAMKHWYRLMIFLFNLVIHTALYYGGLIPTQAVRTFILFSINWTSLLISFMSAIGLASGLDLNLSAFQQKKQDNQLDIIISNLNIPNLFHNINLTIPFRSKVAITGANASGKTMLCRIISGIEKTYLSNIKAPTDCSMITDICDIFNSEKEQLKKNPEWHLNFSKYNYLLEKNKLSTGETNFLLIVSSILTNQKVLILDEVLDSINYNMLEIVLNFLIKTNNTIIVITHREDIKQRLHMQIHIEKESITINDTK